MSLFGFEEFDGLMVFWGISITVIDSCLDFISSVLKQQCASFVEMYIGGLAIELLTEMCF